MFGDLLFKAQIDLLQPYSNTSSILIIGGGSGQLLRYCLQHNPQAHITYVDASKKMIGLAQASVNETQLSRVTFYTKNILEWKSNTTFDLVLVPFVVDVFDPKDRKLLLKRVHHLYTKNGAVIVTDFQTNPSLFQKLLIRFMYSGFQLIGAAKYHKLPQYEKLFTTTEWKIKGVEKYGTGWYKNLVVSYLLQPE